MRKTRRIAIVGAGLEGISPVTPGVSFRELTYAAASSGGSRSIR